MIGGIEICRSEKLKVSRLIQKYGFQYSYDNYWMSLLGYVVSCYFYAVCLLLVMSVDYWNRDMHQF